MTVRRIALQAAVGNLTQNQAITVDANGLLISAGLITYAYIQNVSATDKILGRASAGAGVIEEIACTAAGRALLDDADAAAQRTTLGLGTIATQAANNVSISGGAISGITDLAVADGGTGSSTAAAARLALGLVDANDRMPAAMAPTKILNSYWHASNDEKTVVAGTWVQTNDASQTDYDPLINPAAGYVYNTSSANSDEIHFGSLGLNAGTYKVSVSYVKVNNTGILEVLHGTTSLGTQDTYAAATTYNQVVSFTYSPATYVSGNFRIKLNGKNGSSTAYRLYVSRIEIIRTG
jgi:hypothetical protein